MKVQDIMTREVQTCTLDTTLPQVARLMQAGGCGAIPVIDAQGRVAGMVTDRDITLALVSTTRKPINIAAREVMSHAVYAALPSDDVRTALAAMKEHRVRRLPIVGSDGRLRGILSIDDVILKALSPDAPTPLDIVQSLREILRRFKEEPELALADVPL